MGKKKNPPFHFPFSLFVGCCCCFLGKVMLFAEWRWWIIEAFPSGEALLFQISRLALLFSIILKAQNHFNRHCRFISVKGDSLMMEICHSNVLASRHPFGIEDAHVKTDVILTSLYFTSIWMLKCIVEVIG